MYHLTYMYCWLGIITTLMHTHREQETLVYRIYFALT
jgi:hypothetical protein